jgi:hypothetical protein
MNKVRNLLLYSGYVESNSWAALAFRNEDGFDSVEEALQHLGKCILEGIKLYHEYNKKPSKDCCSNESNSNKFCSQCGQSLQKEEIDQETVEVWLQDIHVGNNDSIPYEFWDILSANGWTLWNNSDVNTDFNNVVVIHEKAEVIISRAAFGRIFDAEIKNWDPREYVKGSMVVPESFKVFHDDK